MSFRQEFARIPKVAMVIAGMMYAALAALLLIVVLNESDFADEPFLIALLVAFGVPVLLAAYVLMVGYVYADAKRRGMRYVMWTWVAALVPNAIGIIFYFVMRDSLPQPCPRCTKPTMKTYVFCPHCGFGIAPRCTKCGSSVRHEWSNCAFCGSALPGAGSASAAPPSN